MTDKQYASIEDEFKIIRQNQAAINGNIGHLASQLQEVLSDIGTVLRNQKILGADQDKLIKQVDEIESMLRK